MDKVKLQTLLIKKSVSLKKAMYYLGETSERILFVVDDQNVLLGTVTDGDIRRGLLNGLSFSENTEKVMRKEFISLRLGTVDLYEHAKKIMVKNKIEHITILNDRNVIIDAILWTDLFGDNYLKKKERYSNQVVVMAAGKVPVFGIYERNGTVRVEVVKNVTAESLLNMTIKTVRRGSIVYTDKFRSYDALMFCGYRHLRIDHKKRFSSGKVYINGLEGFWSYAKERIIKFHGVSKEKFPLYLKEMEFRYNNRHNSLFNLIVQKLCNLVPNLL